MLDVRYCILGAGPSGLSFANYLQRHGETSFVLLEKESDAGGLCRSRQVDGAPLDIGGGHFLDVRRAEVLTFLFSFLPREQWTEFNRKATIRLHGLEIDHPLEANLWQLPLDRQLDYLESIAEAGCVRGTKQPDKFSDWLTWKLGEKIVGDYMLPYNQKIWSIPLDELGTYWLEKLPSVSFRESLQTCIEKRPAGTLPAHAQFLYPTSVGYGEVWRRMGEALGDNLKLDCPLTSLDLENRIVNSSIRYKTLVNSIPWQEWWRCAELPQSVQQIINALKFVSVDIDYVAENSTSKAHWVYEPEAGVPYHRLLLRHNFCAGSRGYWTETNSSRALPCNGFRYTNKYAYPVNTTNKPALLQSLHAWARENNIIPIGRWGGWEHINSDVAVESAMQAAATALDQND